MTALTWSLAARAYFQVICNRISDVHLVQLDFNYFNQILHIVELDVDVITSHLMFSGSSFSELKCTSFVSSNGPCVLVNLQELQNFSQPCYSGTTLGQDCELGLRQLQ